MQYEKQSRYFESYSNEDFSFHMHLHSEIEIIYLHKGCMDVTIGENSRRLYAGQLGIAFPHIPHGYEAVEGCHNQLLLFRPDLVDDYEKTVSLRRPVLPFLTQDQIHPDVLYVLRQVEGCGKWEGSRRLVKGYSLIIMSHLISQLTFEEVEYDSNADTLGQLLRYVDKNFRAPLTLESVALNLGISKYTLSRLFSHRIGSSFNAYLNSIRVDYACHLLSVSDKSVTEIAYACGFESQSTFYRAFRSKMKITPFDYRKNLKKEESSPLQM